MLTIATGEPAFDPWVIDDAPETGEGFEAAVAFAVAAEMGYEGDSVVWTRTTFDEAIQPGAKSFDLNLQQYSITPERAENIDFSLPYFTSNQAIVALDGSAAEGADDHRRSEGLKFGAQAGTTSLAFINDVIQPNEEPFVFDDNVGAKAALEANQIDAVVFDLYDRSLHLRLRDRGTAASSGNSQPRAGDDHRPVRVRPRKGQRPHRCVDARSPPSPTAASSTQSTTSGCPSTPRADHRRRVTLAGTEVHQH